MSIFKERDSERLYTLAVVLALITIGYNLLEGIVSVFFGAKDETLALLGFGVDSFVEVISGAGILHMVLRIKRNQGEDRKRFEKAALFITGFAFMLLCLGLVTGSVVNVLQGTHPSTTLAGIIISIISLLTMFILYNVKLKTGRALDSKAIIADAHCTLTCFYLSGILLGSSILYELFKIGYFDLIGGLGIAFFAFREGREALEEFFHKEDEPA
jgi:divalent metal cation (Fe/Co/Zn/Cd) transporter